MLGVRGTYRYADRVETAERVSCTVQTVARVT